MREIAGKICPRYLLHLKKFFYAFFSSLISDRRKPMIIEHDMKEEPPYEINGNVIPFVE